MLADLRSHSIQSSSLWTAEPGDVSFVRLFLIGLVWPIWRASLIPARRISVSALLSVLEFGLHLGWRCTHQLDWPYSSGR